MSEQEIHDICKKYNIKNYTINSDGSIDVNGSVYLNDKNLTELPLKFNKVGGDFDCSGNYITSLLRCPKEVGGYFYCSGNFITSLLRCPKEVGGYFYCYNIELTTLKGYNGDYNKIRCYNKEKLIRKRRKFKIQNKV